jgi:hypothetical protein
MPAPIVELAGMAQDLRKSRYIHYVQLQQSIQFSSISDTGGDQVSFSSCHCEIIGVGMPASEGTAPRQHEYPYYPDSVTGSIQSSSSGQRSRRFSLRIIFQPLNV